MAIKPTKTVGRNDLCPCGSELKAKFCHQDHEKMRACNAVANMYMARLISEERKKRGLDPYVFVCEKCGKGTDKPKPSELIKNVLLCPNEECGGIVKVNEKPKSEQKPEPKAGTNEAIHNEITKQLPDLPEKKSLIILEA